MPICRLAYADFKMAYADTFIGRFAGGGLLCHWILPTEFHIVLVGEVGKPLAPPMPVVILNALRAVALDCCHIQSFHSSTVSPHL